MKRVRFSLKMKAYKKELIANKLNQLIERRNIWMKLERKAKRHDYQTWFELTSAIHTLEWVLGKRKELYDYGI